jgi:hypothetical protein
MEKLKLNLNELTVESFQSGQAQVQPGTVEAHGAMASSLRTCIDTNCGASYCVTLPCAC